MWKLEGELEQATQDFNYFNDLLKDELPKLFALEQEFIRPLFQSFYYMQLNIFYTLHERMQNCDIGYFDLTLDVEEAFHKKRGDIQERTEQLSIVRFKTTGQRRPPKYGGRPALEAGKSPALLTAGPSSSTSKFGSISEQQQESDSETQAPPPYSPPPMGKASTPGLAGIVAGKAKPPPPPKPKPMRLGGAPAVETVTALYDYAAQAESDLSFKAGDVIEIVQRTQNENEWWTGRVHGKEGQFPGNYVKLGS